MLVRRPLTALAFRQQTQVQMHARQQRLVHEVHYRAYVKVHEARMRMLFGLDDSVNGGAAPNRNGGRVDADKRLSTHSGPAAVVDPVAAGEAAYLDSLDASKSEEEARVLQVIASIDAALKRQLASAYQRSMDDCGVSAAACSERKLPGDHTVLLSGTAAAQTPLLSSSPSSPASFALRRPAIVEAVIASTTQRVEAFVDQLLPYQQEGVRWLLRLNALEHMNGILADDMGLGKTAQTVVYLSCYKDMLEQEVQRPLEVLHARHTQLCQRALGLAIVGTELAVPALPSWLSWCASATVAEEVEEGGDGRGDSRRADSSAQPINGEASFASITSANAPLTAARACGRSIQLVKEVKRWLWQLDEAGERDGHTTAAVTRASSPFAFSSSPLPTRQRQALQSSCNPFETSEQQQVQQCDTSATATTSPAVNVVALVPIKRRRGRPSKHLSAMMTAAALAAGGSTQPTSSARSSLTSSPAPQSPLSLSSMIAHQCQLSTCSSALDARLDREWSRFRPVLIIAPLSTLPHWNAEFRRFSRRGAAAGGERGKGAAVAPSPLQNSSGAPLRDTQERFTAYVLNGPRGEREERMRAFLEHTQGLEEPPPQSPVTPTTAPPQASMTTPVLVIPHDMLTKPLSGPLRQISRVRWHVVVIDEAQRIKSAQSSLFKKVCLLDSISRLVLTGTPLQNNTTELFSLLQFLAPQSFTSSAGALFEQLDSALMAASRSSALEDRELHLLLCRRVHRLLMPFILRREKTILKAALPPLRDYAVLCPLLPFQAAQLAEVRRKHEEGTLSGNPHIQYRKILLHPYTTQAFFYVDEQVVQTSGKLLVLDFMMRFLQRTRHKFLVFCGWTLVLDVVETLCGMRGIPYVRLDGKTPVEKREANIEGFNRPFTKLEGEGEGESINGGALSHPHARRTGRRNSNGGSCARTTATAAAAAAHGGGAVAEDDEHELAPAPCCFLISKVAGGVGLNLQAADAVFLLDVDYNPQRDAQALSRVYRVGQTREVRVFRLVIDHPIERNIVAIHEAKENLGRAVVQAGRYDLHSSVQEREAALQQIFRAGTLSKLSEQLSMTSPTVATASEATATVVAAGAAAEEDGPFEAVREKDGEDDDVEDCGDASVDARGAASSAWRCGGSDNEGGTAEDEDAEVDEEEQMDMPNDAVSPTSMQTPTDLHRVFLNCPNGPLPSALKKPKTETTEDDNHDKATVSHTITNAAALEQIRLQRPQPQPQPHRKRRHISFKLENDTEEYSKDSSHSEDGEAGLSTDGDPRSGIESKVLGAETPSTAAPGGKQDDEAHTPTAAVVPPAAHLLAMRERLEEVLLRHDGERGVLQDMFRTLEASLAAAK
ncbi:hypothetical protein ABB37_02098 [Leptomonas pyrrhocoris]|uniref:Helicase ATP-binding domain-containing protein n=1 Tax=Leptomonas pyrrhocoris TaxID=157538 RepID=A0A0N0VGY3_LEPPY|nr:hypothetical protein ABB37_02098 [Leptomonas pyrrhocoris]XP_015662384.1 hypothetical protein ABB37_02098 [Leptomonas pyrrhocoris]KPA83944.1 hypothetical protein ABB37_02098 [Leptomonas pyrrhocoris]KPA83945.1 hypothetical protein ABB37_02098 [Leptomonas pyrrhocoris]|eukprot:XP_015662383.1 hypothetical protein ABB37_02098 [Leptomonas pyrrhocoris]